MEKHARVGAEYVQLQLDLPWSENTCGRSVAWIVSLPGGEIERAERWLASEDRFGRAPFFLDAVRGSALINPLDVVVLINRASNSTLMCIPKSIQVQDPARLLTEIVATGKPLGIFGGTPQIHDAILMKDLGSALRNAPRTSFRSKLDLMLDRLSSRSFRADATAIARMCEAAVSRWRLPDAMTELVQKIWADSISRALLESDQISATDLVASFVAEARRFRLKDLHHVANELEAVVRKAEPSLRPQLSLFDDDPVKLSAPVGSGLRHIRCSAIALTYESAALPQASDQSGGVTRHDVLHPGRKIPDTAMRLWLKQTTPLSIVPDISINRTAARGQTRIDVRLVPEFLNGLHGDFSSAWKDSRSSGKFRLIPQLGERPVSPNTASVKLGETAYFSTAAVPSESRCRFNLLLLTPNFRSVKVLFPHLI